MRGWGLGSRLTPTPSGRNVARLGFLPQPMEIGLVASFHATAAAPLRSRLGSREDALSSLSLALIARPSAYSRIWRTENQIGVRPFQARGALWRKGQVDPFHDRLVTDIGLGVDRPAPRARSSRDLEGQAPMLRQRDGEMDRASANKLLAIRGRSSSSLTIPSDLPRPDPAVAGDIREFQLVGGADEDDLPCRNRPGTLP